MQVTEALRQFTVLFVGCAILAGVVHVLSKLLRCRAGATEFVHPERGVRDAVIAFVIFAVGATLGLAVFRILRDRLPESVTKDYPLWCLVFACCSCLSSC